MILRTIIISVAVLAATIATAATHEYTVTLSSDLSSLDVEARLAPGVRRLSARSRDARDSLVRMRDCDTGNELPGTSRTVESDDDLRCLSYSVDLRRIERPDRRSYFTRATIVVPVTDWMWRPRLGGNDEIVVSFRLPDGIGVSVPWRPLEDGAHRFLLRSSPQSGTGLSVFGQFDRQVVDVAGASLRIVSLPSETNPIGAEAIRWTQQTAEIITLAYGRFPNPHARVILFPVTSRRDSSAVPFGRVVRDGGETIELLMDPGRPSEAFTDDGTATHEFSHLMLPYITRDERWVSEGFAQYYQNVLLARAGRYSQQDAWRKLREGLERGRESVPDLSPNEAAGGGERNSRMKIYWSSAALALMADIELRRRSGGAESLDQVLERLQACCLPSRRTWSGRDLFEKLDSLIETPLFMELYDRHADAPGFPDFEPLLERPEFAEIRAAITARRYTGEPDK